MAMLKIGRKTRSAVLATSLFGLSLATTAVAASLYFRKISPPPQMLVLSPKLAHYRAHADQYDTVLIGTSRTQFHIIPDAFESTARACGVSNVYNFGVFGLTGAEQDWLIDQVTSIGKGHLHTLIIEEPLPETRAAADAINDRARFFQDPALYRARLDSVWSYSESAAKRVFRTGVFAYGTAFDLSGIGRAASRFFPEPAPEPLRAFSMHEDGFEALDELEKTTADIKARNDAFRADVKGFETTLALYAAPDDTNTDRRAAYIAAKLEAINARGVRAAYFVSPDLKELNRTPVVGERVRNISPKFSVLNFNRPDQHDELFQRELWADFSHLNRAGAAKLSVKAGEEFCALERAREENRLAVR